MKILDAKQFVARADEERGEAPELSVIIPVFEEEESLDPLHRQLTDALTRLNRSYEIVYVDDGSEDGTAERLRQIAESDAHVLVVGFRRNFGQTAALQAGIDYSRGDLLVFMDGDLQNDPTDIGRLLEKLDEGNDVVSGWRKDRHDELLRRKVPSWVANWLISRVTGVRLNDYGCTLKAYRRETLSDVRLYGEMHRFIPAYASWSGAKIAEIPVTHHPRRFGRSKYGLWRTFRVLLDLLTIKLLGSYATKPIYFFGAFGLILWGVAFVCGLIVLAEKLLPPYPEAHNNPLLLLAVFLATLGVQFTMLGLLAELIMRTYHESRGRPAYKVRQILVGGALKAAAGDRRPARSR